MNGPTPECLLLACREFVGVAEMVAALIGKHGVGRESVVGVWAGGDHAASGSVAVHDEAAIVELLVSAEDFPAREGARLQLPDTFVAVRFSFPSCFRKRVRAHQTLVAHTFLGNLGMVLDGLQELVFGTYFAGQICSLHISGVECGQCQHGQEAAQHLACGATVCDVGQRTVFPRSDVQL